MDKRMEGSTSTIWVSDRAGNVSQNEWFQFEVPTISIAINSGFHPAPNQVSELGC